MSSTVYIYALIDNKTPLYVGATSNIKNRLSGHLGTTLKEYPNKDKVNIIVLEKTNRAFAGEAEKLWTHKYVSMGFPLIRVTTKFYPKEKDNKGYSDLLIACLASVFEKSTQTIRRWILQKDDRLSSDKAKDALRKYSQLATLISQS